LNYIYFLDTSDKILNEIAVEFTSLINLGTLLPYLLKHGLLTNDESCSFQSAESHITPTKKAQELLQLLKRKGSKILQKLLCCLNEETEHSGHKDIALKLKDAMKLHDLILICPLCKKMTKMMQQPDVLDDLFTVISTNCPAEKWEELANVLGISEHNIEQIRISLQTDSTQSVNMVLGQWRQLHLQAATKELVAKLSNSKFRYVLHKL